MLFNFFFTYISTFSSFSIHCLGFTERMAVHYWHMLMYDKEVHFATIYPPLLTGPQKYNNSSCWPYKNCPGPKILLYSCTIYFQRYGFEAVGEQQFNLDDVICNYFEKSNLSTFPIKIQKCFTTLSISVGVSSYICIYNFQFLSHQFGKQKYKRKEKLELKSL